MDPVRWREIERIFEELADQTPAKRAILLSSLNPDLRGQLEKLLASDAHGHTLVLQAVAEGESLLADAPDRCFGPYRSTGLLGEGGMGAVYRAVRDDQAFHKQVAIKVLHLGMETPAAVERCRNERQILASLEHPYIARLIDGGETSSGLPYIVLEYVEGEPITAYCERHALSRERRLQLFLNVCEAVEYAHRNLVVHRDLKPANILVTPDGTPKLLDFGIARLLERDAQQTTTLFQALTPNYASPEQVRGEFITTASDVYSLGVVLYELLTGERPYDIPTLSPVEIDRVVCEVDPTPPGISSDLDNILLMALRKEPNRRYRSVEQFAEDIQNSLTHLPVIARKPTPWYRTGKWVRRNRLLLTAVSIVLLVLCGGIVTSRHEAQRAERRFNQVRELANVFLFDLDEQIREVPGTTRARETLVKTALRYLDSLAAESGQDQALKMELANAYEKVGDVQGSPSMPSLGKSAEALISYSKARRLLAEVLASHPSDTRALRVLAQTSAKAADIQRVSARMAEAHENVRVAIEAVAKLRKEGSSDPALEYLEGGLSLRVGDEFMESNLESARFWFKRSLEAYERADGLQASDRYRNAEAAAMSRIGRTFLISGDPAQASSYFKRALAIREDVAQQHPENHAFQRGVALTLTDVGDAAALPTYFNLGDTASADASYRRALGIHESLAHVDAKSVLARTDLVFLLNRLGAIHIERHPEQAARYLERALALGREIGESATRPDIQDGLATAHQRLAAVDLAQRRFSTGVREAETALRIFDANRATVGSEVAARMILGDLLLASARPAAARQNWEQALHDLGGIDPKRSTGTSLKEAAELYSRLAEVTGTPCEWNRKSLVLWQECRSRHAPARFIAPKITALEALTTHCSSLPPHR